MLLPTDAPAREMIRCALNSPTRHWHPNLKLSHHGEYGDIQSREQAIEYAQKHDIPIGNISKENIYSRDWNIWHLTCEGGDLENPWNRPKKDMFQITVDPQDAPDEETEITIAFEQGLPVGIDGKKLPPLEILHTLNQVGGANGIGRADLVETRLVGMKSRGVYETPAGTILHYALRELEMITMDSETLALKNALALQYAGIVYAGKWFTHFRECMDAYMKQAAHYCTGEVRLVLYKGNISLAGRKSPYSLYIEDLASFGESTYDHRDATGFINLYGLSTGVQSLVYRKRGATDGPAAEMRTMAGFSEG